MRGHGLTTKILNPVWKWFHRSDWLAGMAIVVSPSVLAGGALARAPLSRAAQNPSRHDLFLTGIALTIEVALFLLVPLYLRSKRREKIRSRIRIISVATQNIPSSGCATLPRGQARDSGRSANWREQRLVHPRFHASSD